MRILIALLVGLPVFDLFGYLIHRSLHSPWTGPAHKAHKAHHETLYPPGDFLSDKYRSPGGRSTVLLFLPPMALATFALFLVFSWPVALALTAEMAAWGLLSDQVHDAFHVRGHWMEKVPGFARLRAMHEVHHHEQKLNFGIMGFMWDAVFGTVKSMVRWRRP